MNDELLDALPNCRRSGVSGVQASNGGLSLIPRLKLMEYQGLHSGDLLASAVEPGEGEAQQGDSQLPVPENERPCFRVYDGWTVTDTGRKLRPGVWLHAMSAPKGKGDPVPVDTWVCGPLYVEAQTFDSTGNNFGRLLRFKNTAGRWREWAMPMELLRGDGTDLRGELLAMGLAIDPNRRFPTWRTTCKSDRQKRRCVARCKSAGAARRFVLPDAVIGPDAAGVIFQSGERGHEEHGQGGRSTAGVQKLRRALSAIHCSPWACRLPLPGRCWRAAMPRAAGCTSLAIRAPAKPRFLKRRLPFGAGRTTGAVGERRPTAWKGRRRCSTIACLPWTKSANATRARSATSSIRWATGAASNERGEPARRGRSRAGRRSSSRPANAPLPRRWPKAGTVQGRAIGSAARYSNGAAAWMLRPAARSRQRRGAFRCDQAGRGDALRATGPGVLWSD
jgi:hypothetical protein